MTYNQNQIDEEFREAASELGKCVRAMERGTPDARLADHHDDCLGRLSVYEFLQAKPFLRSCGAMLEELRWFREADVEAPANALDANRFDASRYTLVKSLIARFEGLSSSHWPAAPQQAHPV